MSRREGVEVAREAINPLNDVLATFGLFNFGKASESQERKKRHRHARTLFALLISVILAYGSFLTKEALKARMASPLREGAVEQDDKCHSVGEQPSDCEPSDTTAEIFFWNLTNPNDTRSGQEPIIVELGPYVLTRRTFTADMSFDSSRSAFTQVFSRFYRLDDDLTAERCSACDAQRDEIVGPNLAWWSYLRALNNSEHPMYWRWAPQTVLDILSGIEQVLRNGAVSAFSEVDFTEGFEAVALQQWTTCEPLNGVPISVFSVPPELPDRPELCTFDNPENSTSTTILPNETTGFFNSMRKLSSSIASVDDVRDLALGDSADAAQNWNVSTDQAKLLQAYLEHSALVFGEFTLRSLEGDFLGPNSGGPFVKRNVSEWIFGWEDPVVARTLFTLACTVSCMRRREPSDERALLLRAIAIMIAGELPGLSQQKIFRESSELDQRGHDELQSEGNDAKANRSFTQQTWMSATRQTGQQATSQPFGMLAWNDKQAYEHAGGMIDVQGIWPPNGGGKTEQLSVFPFDAFIESPVPLQRKQEMYDVKGVRLVKYGIDRTAFLPCSTFGANAGVGNCIFPLGWKGIWNISSWSNDLPPPGVISTGRLLVADPKLQEQVGLISSNKLFGRAGSEDSEWRVGIEPLTGAVMDVRVTAQMNAQVRRSESEQSVFVGTDDSQSSESLLPVFWLRLRTARSARAASEIKSTSAWLAKLDNVPLLLLPILALVLLVAVWDVTRQLESQVTYAGSSSRFEVEVQSTTESEESNESFETADNLSRPSTLS